MNVSDYRFTSHSKEAIQKIKAEGKIPTYKGAYVSLSYFCNTDICDYCYARSQQVNEVMSISDFDKVLGWLRNISNHPEVYIVGGEPTALPNLTEYLDVVAKYEMQATIYTNGAFGVEHCRSYISHPGLQELAFHYEPLFFSTYKGYRERFINNVELASHHKETTLIYTISSSDFDYQDLLAIASKYKNAVTWIFAAPTSGKTTPFFTLNEMRLLGPKIQRFLLEAKAKKIKISPDLAIPLCIFDKDFLETYKDEFGLVKWCQPFAYFKPDLSVQFCTALPIYTATPPINAEQLSQIIQNHRMIDVELKQRPTFPECRECELHLRQICQGGCMTYKVYA